MDLNQSEWSPMVAQPLSVKCKFFEFEKLNPFPSFSPVLPLINCLSSFSPKKGCTLYNRPTWCWNICNMLYNTSIHNPTTYNTTFLPFFFILPAIMKEIG